jgi:UDP-N-acetyl-D-glucosamine/UDP-N-acetyl-D-galactosamine dehydrogenase
MERTERTIAVVGLGYVGLPVAAAFARCFRVVGFDIDTRRIAQLRDGIDSTREVAADALAGARLAFTDDASALRGCDFFIVAVPTPVDDANMPDLRPLLAASRTVGGALGPGAIVVFESTVYPGATQEECIPVLEAASGLVHGRDFFVGYSPERINPGDRKHTFARIRKIVSACDAATLDEVARVYETVVEAGVHRAPSIKVAEAAKVIENTQRDLNIALMNELAVLFKRLDIDTHEVLEAAGSKWNFMPFKPGLVGGHCIGVDPYYLTYQAERHGYIPQVILAGRRINDNMGRFVARSLVKLMLRSGIDVARSRVGVLGITFKENCPDVRNSKAADIVHELRDHGIEVVVSDPFASEEDVARAHGLSLGAVDEAHPVDALVVAVSHAAYRALQAPAVRALLRGERPVVADVKSILPRAALEVTGVTVWRL